LGGARSSKEGKTGSGGGRVLITRGCKTKKRCTKAKKKGEHRRELGPTQRGHKNVAKECGICFKGSCSASISQNKMYAAAPKGARKKIVASKARRGKKSEEYRKVKAREK